jgi:hypothetical protein
MDLKNTVENYAELAMLNPASETKKSVKKALLTLTQYEFVQEIYPEHIIEDLHTKV